MGRYAVFMMQRGITRGTRGRILLAGLTVLSVVLVMGMLSNLSPGLGASSRTITASATDYAVTFSETGLPSGTSWSVTLNGVVQSSTSSTISFSEPDGTYYFTVGEVPGYSGQPPAGNVTVDGQSVSEPVQFSVVVAQYSVNFTQSGLPAGLVWAVTFNGSSRSTNSSSTISFIDPNGSYSFTVGPLAGYAAEPPQGTVTIDGNSVAQPIQFVQTESQYPVLFTAAGLPVGQAWSVTLNGMGQSTGQSSLTFSEPNGTYLFTVGASPGYSAQPLQGNVVVDGGPVSTAIEFAPMPSQFTVTFTQSGLPAGLVWSVTLDGTQLIANSSSPLVFAETNGSYSFSVGTVAGWTANPSTGSVLVQGAPVSVTVSFTLADPGSASAPSAIPASGLSAVDYLLIGVATALVGAVATAVVLLRRRNGKNPPKAETTSTQSGTNGPGAC